VQCKVYAWFIHYLGFLTVSIDIYLNMLAFADIVSSCYLFVLPKVQNGSHCALQTGKTGSHNTYLLYLTDLSGKIQAQGSSPQPHITKSNSLFHSSQPCSPLLLVLLPPPHPAGLPFVPLFVLLRYVLILLCSAL
jgi:hypothetical protein